MERWTNHRQLVVRYGRSIGMHAAWGVLSFLVLFAAIGVGAPSDAPAQRLEAGPRMPLGENDERAGAVDAAQHTASVDANAKLWADLKRAGGRAYVGFRRASDESVDPHTVVRVPRAEVTQYVAALRDRGVELLAVDPRLPFAHVRLQSEAQLAEVRGLPSVRYVEPTWLPVTSADGGGCEAELYKDGMDENWDTCIGLDGSRHTCNEPHIVADRVPWNFVDPRHRIPEAWSHSTGAGVMIAVIDTGISAFQPQLTSEFSDGLSSVRRSWFPVGDPNHGWMRAEWTYGWYGSETGYSYCSHGTRAAGTALAPRDGRNVVGVAYGADGVSYRAMGGVIIGEDAIIENIPSIIFAIDRAGNLAIERGQHLVINMSFGSTLWNESLAQKIRDWTARGVLFVGAAGTTPPPGTSFCFTAFPAHMPEVLAVTGLQKEWVGVPHPSAWAGPETDVGMVIDWAVPSLGQYNDEVGRFGGSSHATAAMSGIAALVWSRFPHLSAAEVISRLKWAGEIETPLAWWPGSLCTVGHGAVDAYKAIGGLTFVRINGPSHVVADDDFTLTAAPGASISTLAFRWNTGATTQSITSTAPCNPRITSRAYSVTVTDTATGIQKRASKTVQFGGCTWD